MILLASATTQEIAEFSLPHGVELLVTGIGPVEAAACVACALARNAYDYVVNAGIAGAYDSTLQIGEAVVVSEERFELDLETSTPLALAKGVTLCERAASDRELVTRLAGAGFRAVRGMTVGRVTASDTTAQRLHALGTDVESMEGFAVLRTAEIAGVRAVEVRGISNYAGERSRSRWSFSAGADALARILSALLC